MASNHSKNKDSETHARLDKDLNGENAHEAPPSQPFYIFNTQPPLLDDDVLGFAKFELLARVQKVAVTQNFIRCPESVASAVVPKVLPHLSRALDPHGVAR